MIVGNNFTEIGDSAIINTGSLVIGLVSLSGYNDTIFGETEDRYFERIFRYSIDGGMTYSQWMPLNNENIASISTNPLSPFIAEYKYTRSGADDTGDLKFIDIELYGTFVVVECPEAYKNSIFAEVFDCYDDSVLAWCNNVTDKLYKYGIVPTYIERGKTGKPSDDEDYIVFWRTVSCFFSLMVNFAKMISDFTKWKDLLVQYLSDRGMFVSNRDDITLLLLLMTNYYREMSKRGTMGIFDYSEDYIGEFYRLIMSDPSEVIVVRPSFLYDGWFVDRNSPLYRGNYEDDSYRVGFISSIDALISGDYSVSEEVVFEDEIVLITADSDIVIEDNFRIDRDNNYEVLLSVLGNSEVSVSIFTSDEFGADIPILSIEDDSPLPSNEVVSISSMPKEDSWYKIRSILFNGYEGNRSSGVNDTYTGINAKSSGSGICRAKVVISVKTGGKISIPKFMLADRINPSINERGSIQVYARNGNDSYNPEVGNGYVEYPDLEDIIKEYLLPYSNTLTINWI